MTAPFLLDSCAALWLSAPGRMMTADAYDALVAAAAAGNHVHLSPITAWEVGQLVARGRYALSLDPAVWFNGMIEEGLALAPMTAEILVAASFLPASDTLRDPADRILAATARTMGWVLVTRDRPLLDYAQAGHIKALRC